LDEKNSEKKQNAIRRITIPKYKKWHCAKFVFAGTQAWAWGGLEPPK